MSVQPLVTDPDSNLRWKNYTVDVIIPTYQSDEKLNQLIRMIYKQSIKPNRVIVLHTEEYQGQEQPLPEIEESNIIVIPIEKQSFDHGGTRKYGASLSDADILLFMTQDAVPEDDLLIEKLLEPYEDSLVSATYARQLPGNKADLVEHFTRGFNYPKNSRVKSMEDLNELGIKTFFCSNVCATYRNSVYQKVGGFVDKTIFNEDMILAARMIYQGCRIAYAAEAKVLHFHKYSYLQQFSRNFDLGVSHKEYADIFRKVKSETEGMSLVKKTMEFLLEQREYLMIPDLILTSGFKYLGYLAGNHYDKLPKDFVIRCSMNKSYWK